jgi:hypothetical protein
MLAHSSPGSRPMRRGQPEQQAGVAGPGRGSTGALKLLEETKEMAWTPVDRLVSLGSGTFLGPRDSALRYSDLGHSRTGRLVCVPKFPVLLSVLPSHREPSLYPT